eukprot:82778_1
MASQIDQACQQFANFIDAIENGQANRVRDVIRSSRFGINTKFANNDTALIRASSLGHLDVVRLLLTFSEVDVKATGSEDETAFSKAVVGGHSSIIRLLISDNRFTLAGACDRRNARTALAEACDTGDLETV